MVQVHGGFVGIGAAVVVVILVAVGGGAAVVVCGQMVYETMEPSTSTDRKAVSGKTARTVWREGRPDQLVLPPPMFQHYSQTVIAYSCLLPASRRFFPLACLHETREKTWLRNNRKERYTRRQPLPLSEALLTAQLWHSD